MRIIVPKRFYPIDERSTSLYFLAGPIRGGGDWQAGMCKAITSIDHNAIVACPCRWDETHPFGGKIVGTEGRFPRQLDWERYYLELAGIAENIKGCIVFWLPLESSLSPHPGPEPYAMDTRGELGEWRMRMKYEKARVVIGAHKDFHGLSQIQRNYSRVLGYEFPISNSMPVTARNAVLIANGG